MKKIQFKVRFDEPISVRTKTHGEKKILSKGKYTITLQFVEEDVANNQTAFILQAALRYGAVQKGVISAAALLYKIRENGITHLEEGELDEVTKVINDTLAREDVIGKPIDN